MTATRHQHPEVFTDSPARTSDAAAIERSLGEPTAFSPIFERHFERVHEFAARRAGADLADEISSEVFVQAFDSRRRYDRTRSDALPWLLGIASNVLRKHWRTERAELRASQRLRLERPADGLGQGLELGDLGERLSDLPRRQRDVVFLYALADLSYQQIAEALGISVGTVRSRLSRARSALGQTVESTPAEIGNERREP